MIKLKLLSPKGGHLAHCVDITTGRALCGYRPSSPTGSLIRGRAGWRGDFRDEISCDKCRKKFDPKIHEVIL